MTYQLQQKLTRSYLQVPTTRPFSGKTIGQSFNEMADRKPDKEMYVFYADNERITCQQMQQESQQFAGGLLKLGLKKGDALAVWGGSHYEWLLATFAAVQLGLVIVHLRSDFTLDVKRRMFSKLGVKVVVLTRSPGDLFDELCKIVPELLTNPADNLDCKSVPTLRYVINAGTTTSSGAFSVEDIMEMGKTVDKAKVIEACEKTDIDDEVAIFFTSGSTGLPKAVTHSHKSLYLLEFKAQIETLGINYDNKSPWTPKLGQVSALLSMSAQDGVFFPIYVEDGTTIMVSPGFDLKVFLKAVQDERITGAILFIHHLSDIMNYPKIDDYDFSSFEMAIVTGSTIPPSLMARARKLFKHVLQSYCANEGFAATQTRKDPIKILEAPAYPLVEGSEVKVVDEEDQVVPINTIGEMCFRGEFMFMYYWGDEEKTRAALRPNGWYYSGDLGTLDEKGYVRLEGRKAELIIREAILLAPGNVEKVLDQHPAVDKVMVVGVPDEQVGEEVCACVRLYPSAKATKEELIEFCKDKITSISIPRYVLLMEAEFPATETGKFDRKKIAEAARITLGLQHF